MSDFTQTTVDGNSVSVSGDGSCWYCEEALPTTPARVSVGPVALDVGVCGDCHEELEAKDGE